MITAPEYSNCLFWAVYHWWKRGGYISIRRSHQIRWLPHFLWSMDLKTWYSYVPLDATIPWWHLIFEGHVIENFKVGTNITDV